MLLIRKYTAPRKWMAFILKGISMLQNSSLAAHCASTALRSQENEPMWSSLVTCPDAFWYLQSLIYKHIQYLYFTAVWNMNYSEKTKSGRRAAVQTKVQSIKRLLLFDFKRIYRLLFRMVQNQVCVLFCWGLPSLWSLFLFAWSTRSCFQAQGACFSCSSTQCMLA